MRPAACLLSLLLFASAALADSVDELLTRSAAGLSVTHALEARFRQSTTFGFMDVPLESSGKLCFFISPREKRLFWEYREPERSGFSWRDGAVEFWPREASREPTDMEKRFLNGIADQLWLWMTFDPAELKKRYSIRAGHTPLGLAFIPKKESPLFSAIELTLAPDFSCIAELQFSGHQDDVTTLRFEVERVNGELSKDCCR